MDKQGDILVTGGAGYIGSLTARELLDAGYGIVVLDNFVKGRRFAVERNRALAADKGRRFALEQGDLGDPSFLGEVFARNKLAAVMHFAAFTEVGESTRRPALYFYNNIINTIHLLEEMASSGVDSIIFSSSAAVYGNPGKVPIPENAPTRPINPYGYTKLAMENMISHYRERSGIEWIALRYFNAAGASADCALGEAHSPESHLIPNAIDMVARGDKVRIFGGDYDTKDGTCLRDYISVMDLARAHRLALEITAPSALNRPYNLGSGNGFTVGEVVRQVGKAMEVEAEPEYAARRPGDPDKLVASSDAFRKAAAWEARDSSIQDILKTAVEWYRKRPDEALEEKPLPALDEHEIAGRIEDELSRNKIIPDGLKADILKRLAEEMRKSGD